MWVNVWLFQFIPLQPIDNQRFAKPVKDVGFLYENSRRQENAESMITPPPLITMSGACPCSILQLWHHPLAAMLVIRILPQMQVRIRMQAYPVDIPVL